jgi:hypothetical protein
MHDWQYDSDLDLFKCTDCKHTMSGQVYRLLFSEDDYHV